MWITLNCNIICTFIKENQSSLRCFDIGVLVCAISIWFSFSFSSSSSRSVFVFPSLSCFNAMKHHAHPIFIWHIFFLVPFENFAANIHLVTPVMFPFAENTLFLGYLHFCTAFLYISNRKKRLQINGQMRF